MLKGVGIRPLPWKFETLSEVFTHEGKNPAVGVTQGGSGRKNSGAKSAATDGLTKTKHPKTKPLGGI